VLKKSFLGDEQNFLGPLMRLASGDVRDHIVSQKTTTDHRIGATELCCGRDIKKSTFPEFLVPFDFRLLQQCLPTGDSELSFSSYAKPAVILNAKLAASRTAKQNLMRRARQFG